MGKGKERGEWEALNGKAERICYFLEGGKAQWALEDVGALPADQACYVAAKALPQAVEALFADELKFKDWFETAAGCDARQLEASLAPWMEAIVALGKMEAPIAKAYIEDMVALTPARFFMLKKKRGISWQAAICLELGSKYRDWSAVIGELVDAGYEPEGATKKPASSVKPPADIYAQSRAFSSLVECDGMEAGNFINNCSDKARPYILAYAAELLAKHHIENGHDMDYSWLGELLEECEECPGAIEEYMHSWMYAIQTLCKAGKKTDASIIDRMIDAVPIKLLSTECMHYEAGGCDWFEYMAKGSRMFKQAGGRARARFESEMLEKGVDKPESAGLCALDAALAQVRVGQSKVKRKRL